MGKNDSQKPVSVLYIGVSKVETCALAAHPQILLTQEKNSLTALNYLKSNPAPDAILCELNVLGWNGFEIHDYLRSDAFFNCTAFILVCNEFNEEVYKKAWKGKIDDYFVLPLPEIDGLIERIRFLVNFRMIEKDILEYNDRPIIKRLFDILVAFFALIILSPLFLIVALAIRMESKGKVYYKSKRYGKGMVEFDFYKFRSMKVGADAEIDKLAKEKNQYASEVKTFEIDYSKPCPECAKRTDGTRCSEITYIGSFEICDYWLAKQKEEIKRSKPKFVKISNDPRVTKVGKFIRNTSIDELPQLINVLKGDMSIVGNRPLPIYEGRELSISRPSLRFHAPVGITGVWQVELRGQGGVMSDAKRIDLDSDYANHYFGGKYSFWYDLKLIFRTAKALFQKDSV